MTGAGMEDDENLWLRAGLYPLAETLKEDGVMIDVFAGILLSELFVGEVFVDMDGRLAPVGCSPRHVYTGAIGIVGKYLIQLIGILGFKDGFGACCGIGCTRGSGIDVQTVLTRQ
jgi:hypothetical protein